MTATSGEHIRARGKINVKTYEPTTYDQPPEGPACADPYHRRFLRRH
jgi:hypothetical protein